MKKKFSASEITQEVSCEWKEDGVYGILRNMPGEGYKHSLDRHYMKNLKTYVENVREEFGAERRILFLTENRMLARQGFLIFLNQLSAKNAETQPDDYDYSFLKDAGETAEEVLLVSEREAAPEVDLGSLLVEFPGISLKGQSSARERSSLLETVENVLFEWGCPVQPEQAIAKVLKLHNPNVAVWLRPAGDYEYLAKRLTFEGGYQVIALDNMRREDYLDCGLEYLSYHHFESDRKVLSEVLDELMVFRGEHLCEEDVYLHLNRCMNTAMKQGKRSLRKEELALCYGVADEDSAAQWDRVIGLKEVKEELERQMAAAQVMGGRKVRLYGHIILEGPPGTGKSKMARLYAKRLAQKGIANGRFIDAQKADVVGRYVGQTAYLVNDLFRRAEGGVLFLDEASFLLADDQFVREAVVELVRYMELYPQTTVIFATYPKEGRRLLACNPGFRSRISRVLTFQSYSDQELWEILQTMAQDYDFIVEESGRGELERYLGHIRNRENFGNAREVRKLLEASIAEFGMRMDKKTGKGGVGNNNVCNGDVCDSNACGGADVRMRILKAEDLRGAGEYLQKQVEESERQFGFAGS